jgi:hypothetical protein
MWLCTIAANLHIFAPRARPAAVPVAWEVPLKIRLSLTTASYLGNNTIQN